MAYVSKNTRQGNKLGRGAVFENRSAALSGEFGMKMLHEKFPDHAALYLAKLGTYSRGPRKGQPRGYIHWLKVIEGGWDYSRFNSRGVMRPGCFEWCVRESADTESALVVVPIDPRPDHARAYERYAEEIAEQMLYLRETLEGETLDKAIEGLRGSEERCKSRMAARFEGETERYLAELAALTPVE